VTLPATPPTVAAANRAARRGDSGWPVYALQRALLAIGYSGVGAADGDFGARTDRAVKRFQRNKQLAADGIAGPATRRALADRVCQVIDKQVRGVPAGLARNLARGEGGDNPAAVNWSVPGGVDCGLFQLRVYGPAYSRTKLEQAFCPVCSGGEAMRAFLKRRDGFLGRAWVGQSMERAGRCALLAHNWPAGADFWSRTGHTSSPARLASWVPAGVKFPDGAPVRTWDEWAAFYAMGGPHGEASMAHGVKW
jgi:hypothetical protein